MRKYLFMILVCVCACFLPTADIAAETVQETVYDNAGILTDQEEELLREYAGKYEKYDITAIFLTVDDACGKSSMTYSDDFYDEVIDRTDGVLYMIDMDNRNIYINTVGKCIDQLTDAKIEKILDASYQLASEKEYFSCLERMHQKAYAVIKKAENPYLYAISFGWGSILSVIAITVAIVALCILKHHRSNRRPLADKYLNNSFQISDKQIIYQGSRDEVIRDYYKENTDSGGSGSGSHTSAGGRSHGGGGHSF